MPQFTVPPSVTQNIARAKAYLKRDEPLRATEALISAMALFEPAKIIGKARYETEVLLMECIEDLNRNTKVSRLLKELTNSSNIRIDYTPGKEAKLSGTLPIVRKALQKEEKQAAEQLEQGRDARRQSLWERGIEILKSGDTPLAKSVLRKLADEFGKEEGVLGQIGEALLGASVYFEAAEFLEQAIEVFPKANKPYADLVTCYTALRELEKVEDVYIKAIKQFGAHPRTYINMARLYLTWGKRDKAYEYAQKAERMDRGNNEAKELMNEADRRR